MYCSGCRTHKSSQDFQPHQRQAKGNKYCRACRKETHRRALDRLHGGSHRAYKLETKYGITPNEFAALLMQQGGLCLICGERPATQVDHHHTTGEIRGILCLKCNAGLGAFKDDVETMYRAIDYLDNGGFVDDPAMP